MHRTVFTASALALMLSIGIAVAQDSSSVSSAAASAAGMSSYPASPDDIQPATVSDPQDFANKAAVANQFEIDSSNVAVQKATTQQVIDFAKKMIDDHTEAGTGLQQAASQEGVSVPTALDADSVAKLKQLQDANGADFEKLYVQMQTDAHVQAVALFSGFAQNGQAGAVKDFAAKTLPTLKMHYQMVLGLPR